MYTGTSMLLAMADTSGAVNRLFVSMPSVSTTIAARCFSLPSPASAAITFAVSAIASYSDVWPNGCSTSSIFDFQALEVPREPGDAIQLRVEREQGRLVAVLQRAEEMARGLTGHRRPSSPPACFH